MRFVYETHYRSHRPDGHIVPTWPPRGRGSDVSALKDCIREEFSAWQKQLREKAKELLCMPPFAEHSAPVLLSTDKRSI